MSAIGASRNSRKADGDPQVRQQPAGGEAANDASPYSVSYSSTWRVPAQENEPVFSYAPGSPERATLKDRLREMSGERIEIPLVIGGRRVLSGSVDDWAFWSNR